MPKLPHWWSTKYRAKYMPDIKKMTELTREMLLTQLTEDFGIQESEMQFENNPKRKQEIEEFITTILDNRESELSESKRIRQEFYMRSRILALFPKPYARYIEIKKAESLEEAATLPKYQLR